MEEPKFEPVPEETAEAPAEPAALPAADEALIPEMPEEPAAPAEDHTPPLSKMSIFARIILSFNLKNTV